ncbi:MAG: hypothetical protein IH968_10930 [Gemmatimonadetes bacterium]|nr:hypothetical protein [Gemmatimonadota bacterium]
MPKKRTTRVFWRDRGSQRRAYGDFRDYSDVGGGREALIPSGAKSATTDADLATELAAQRVRKLEEKRRNRSLLGVEGEAGLAWFAAHHLCEKAKAGKVTEGWLVDTEMHLQRAVDFFGADRDVASIKPKDCADWANTWARSRTVGEKRSAVGRSVII